MSKPKKKSSGLTKFMMSRTVGTSAGRRLVASYIGEAGNDIIEIIKRVSTHLSGSKAGKKTKERVLRFALKIKLMFDDGHLTAKDTLHLVDPIDHLLGKGVKALQSAQKNASHSDMDVALANSVDRLRYEVVDMCGKYMQQKNRDKLDALFRYLGSRDFFRCILTDQKLAQEKAKLLETLVPIVQEHTPHLCKGLGIKPLDAKKTQPQNPPEKKGARGASDAKKRR